MSNDNTQQQPQQQQQLQLRRPRKPTTRRTIYSCTKSFRSTATLAEQIEALANKARKHPSDVMRDAVVSYVKFYAANPSELEVTP